MDNFLDEVHKKSIGEDIRQHNKEKKFQRKLANKDNTTATSCILVEKSDVSKITNCTSSELSGGLREALSHRTEVMKITHSFKSRKVLPTPL